MIRSSVLSKAVFERIRNIDTCTVSNAIERLNGRLRNEGQISGSVVHCIFPNFPPMLGYAVTGRMRAAMEPIAGRTYHENIGWWRYVASVPEPRIMVVMDSDEEPGGGALVGGIHALIGQALGCVAYITNGSVRDLLDIEAIGFQLFAGSVAVSHKYAHISEYGRSVKIDGLTVSPGDLLHGDRHGVHSIPLSVASKIPEAVSQMLREERDLKRFCRSPRFSLQGLEEKLQRLPGDGFETPVNGGPT
jgi:4-hydroxy-4-methyl-2-oxoglutarate aldolase